MNYMLKNLSAYRNTLWWAGANILAGEELYNTLYRQITDMVKRNQELAKEVALLQQENLKLSNTGEI